MVAMMKEGLLKESEKLEVEKLLANGALIKKDCWKKVVL